MKLRVAVFSVVPSPYQRDLFAALARRPEVDLRVFYLEAASPDSPWPEKPLQPYERVLPGFWFSLGTARVHLNPRVPSLKEFDLVIVNTLMSITGQALIRCALRSRPWIFWGERLSRGGALHEFLAAPLNRAAGIAAIGTWAERDYAERFPKPRHFSLPYFCEIAEFLVQPRKQLEDAPVYFFCGQMIARKGVDLLLKAFATLPAGRLLLVGREAELPSMLEHMPTEVRSRIEYAGFQPPEALPTFFARADVFVLPSRYDGWGVVVNQAVAAGLPIICSDMVGAGHDLVEEGVNGRKFEAGNADSLHAAMNWFQLHQDQIHSYGSASREKAVDLTPARGAERWLEAIRTVLER